MEYNISYFGNDIVNRTVKETHQACADFCASTPGGLFWTFLFGRSDAYNKKCYVKSSSSGRKIQQNRISGNRECGLKSKLIYARTICRDAADVTKQHK